MKKESIQMYEEREKFNVLAFLKLYILSSAFGIFIVRKILLLLKKIHTQIFLMYFFLFPVMVYS